MNAAPPTETLSATVSHVASHHRRYPGETVTFYTRITATRDLPALTLEVTVPAGVEVEAHRGPAEQGAAVPWVEFDGVNHWIVWEIPPIRAGSQLEYEVTARLLPTNHDISLDSWAILSIGARETRRPALETVTTVDVISKGDYLRYLPSIYHNDELMGRFLMLFESFWRPITQQIDSLPDYFDPCLTPPTLLPWLAAWFDLELNERWPEARRRELVRSAVSLYRRRGTRQGLQALLELFTGTPVRIIEHRNADLRLGPQARLGAVALGRDNVPNTFTVVVQADEMDADEWSRHRRLIERLIESEKPAHTAYALRIEGPADR